MLTDNKITKGGAIVNDWVIPCSQAFRQIRGTTRDSNTEVFSQCMRGDSRTFRQTGKRLETHIQNYLVND